MRLLLAAAEGSDPLGAERREAKGGVEPTGCPQLVPVTMAIEALLAAEPPARGGLKVLRWSSSAALYGLQTIEMAACAGNAECQAL